MTAHALYPGYIVIDYHSVYAAHKMTLPTRNWSSAVGTTGHGGFESWNTGAIDAGDMIDELVAALADISVASVVYDQATIYQIATPESAPLPVAAKTLAVPGTITTTPNWYAAVQKTFTMYDEEFETVKLVVLDASSGGDFSKHTGTEVTVIENAVYLAFRDPDNAWSSRNGARPAVLRSVTCDLNDKLRGQYGFA